MHKKITLDLLNRYAEGKDGNTISFFVMTLKNLSLEAPNCFNLFKSLVNIGVINYRE